MDRQQFDKELDALVDEFLSRPENIGRVEYYHHQLDDLRDQFMVNKPLHSRINWKIRRALYWHVRRPLMRFIVIPLWVLRDIIVEIAVEINGLMDDERQEADSMRTDEQRERDAHYFGEIKFENGIPDNPMDAPYGSEPEHPADVRHETADYWRERAERAEAALEALVIDHEGELPVGVADYDDYRYCLYCYKPMQKDFRETGHASDCPIMRGREALAKGQDE